MATSRVRSLAEEIRALPEDDRQALAQEVLPVLLSTRAGLEEIDRALTTFSDEELDALIERARTHADVPETTVPSAPEAAGVRVWDVEVMSRGRGPRVGCPPPESVDVAYPPVHNHFFLSRHPLPLEHL